MLGHAWPELYGAARRRRGLQAWCRRGAGRACGHAQWWRSKPGLFFPASLPHPARHPPHRSFLHPCLPVQSVRALLAASQMTLHALFWLPATPPTWSFPAIAATPTTTRLPIPNPPSIPPTPIFLFSQNLPHPLSNRYTCQACQAGRAGRASRTDVSFSRARHKQPAPACQYCGVQSMSQDALHFAWLAPTLCAVI